LAGEKHLKPPLISPTWRWKGREYDLDFLTTAEASRRRAKARGFGFPIKNEAPEVKHAMTKNPFPFEVVQVSSLKIK
jgi:hypothetical protein